MSSISSVSRLNLSNIAVSVGASHATSPSPAFPPRRVVTPYWVMAATESHFQCSPRNSFPPQLEDGEIGLICVTRGTDKFLQAYLEIQPFKLPAAVTDPEPQFNDTCLPDFPRPDSRGKTRVRGSFCLDRIIVFTS